MATYYIDPLEGKAENNGLSPLSPWAEWDAQTLQPGDTVLLRRGRVFRCAILSPDGEEGRPITWGAYGEGPAPELRGSLPLGDPAGWRETAENIWVWDRPLPSEPGNVLLDETNCGTLRWSLQELVAPGDWYDTGFGKTEQLHLPRDPADRLYLYSTGNPALRYPAIEAALYGSRVLARATAHVVFRDLAFRGSGVHGFAAADTRDITLTRCSFSFIGGMVWNRDLKIRFGNGVELWNSARQVRVQDCTFYEIYDSCFTHQGALPYPAPREILFTDCTCARYGMAAYEVRDIIPVDTVFSHNVCREAGVGFAMQGEVLPRRSEIWPQPMGHHLFLWRIETPTPGGEIRVEHNTFGAAPNGAAVYSLLAPAAEAQFTFAGNTAESDCPGAIHWHGGEASLAEILAAKNSDK